MKEPPPEAFGERMAEAYDDWYGTRLADATTPQTVETLAGLAGRGGRVLELAIGTGRVALPLAARGLEVHGIEGSPAMVAKLREKPGGSDIPVTVGDLADVGVEGRFDLIFLVFNTLFNLTRQEAQVRCFRNVARHLNAGGKFVLEAFVPDPSRFAGGQSVRTVHTAPGGVVLEAALHDPVTQCVQYHYVAFGPDGPQLYSVPMRYAWPAELDLMARLAGLELRERWADWDRAPFTASSASHVSVYGRSGAGSGV